MDLHDIWTVENSDSKFWKILTCNFTTKSMGANVRHNIFSFMIKKYTTLAFTGKKSSLKSDFEEFWNNLYCHCLCGLQTEVFFKKGGRVLLTHHFLNIENLDFSS